jgi:hypothetical protein
VPGASTKIARLYHAVAQLTSRGDILAVRQRVGRLLLGAGGDDSGPRGALLGAAPPSLLGAPACARRRRRAVPTQPSSSPSATLPRRLRPPVQTGTSNAAFWESPDSAAFERTPLGVNEYRQEVYYPPYVFRTGRPQRAAPAPPAWVSYGEAFRMGFKFDGGAPGALRGGQGTLGRGSPARSRAPRAGIAGPVDLRGGSIVCHES